MFWYLIYSKYFQCLFLHLTLHTIKDYYQCITLQSVIVHLMNHQCYMWSELQGGRGSERIGSSILKKILELPDSIEQLITYSDTCGSQNCNINIAVVYVCFVSKKYSPGYRPKVLLTRSYTPRM